MAKYAVRFLWNNKGQSVIDHVVECPLPDNWGVSEAMGGFWVRLPNPYGFHGEITFDVDESCMWVPPGRVTAVVRRPEHPSETGDKI